MSFSPAASYDAGVQPVTVVTGDFDNDGHLDLAFANGSGYSVSVLRGDAGGTFQQPAVTSAAAVLPLSLAVGDFDADGKLDLAAVAQHGIEGDDFPALSVMRGNGDGSFQAPADVMLDPGAKAESVTVGDFNGDGTMDLAVTSNVDSYYPGDVYDDVGRVSVLLAVGGGSFAAPKTVPLTYAVESAVVADFNGDGNPDVVAGTKAYSFESGGYVQVVNVLLGDGQGNLTRQNTNWIIDHGRSMAAGDLDGDGDTDLATANGADVRVRLGDGAGGFDSPPGGQSHAAGIGPIALALGDFNRDGVPDIATANGGSGGVSILRGKGGGAFWAPEHFGAGPAPLSLTAGDFDGDGWLDVATANVNGNADENTASVLINDRTWPTTPAPAVSVSDATVTEGNTGTLNATFTLTLSHASSAAVTVQYNTANITATAGNDYAAKSGTVTIPAGQTSATFTVAVTGDRLPEPTETFAVNLGAATNATIGDGQGTGTILDNEPRISINDVSGKEGNGGTRVMTFTVTLSAAYDQAVTVNFATRDGTAKAGEDYLARSGSLTFAAGETVKTITVSVKGDKKREANESFSVLLSSPSSNALVGVAQGLGTIFNDD